MVAQPLFVWISNFMFSTEFTWMSWWFLIHKSISPSLESRKYVRCINMYTHTKQNAKRTKETKTISDQVCIHPKFHTFCWHDGDKEITVIKWRETEWYGVKKNIWCNYKTMYSQWLRWDELNHVKSLTAVSEMIFKISVWRKMRAHERMRWRRALTVHPTSFNGHFYDRSLSLG